MKKAQTMTALYASTARDLVEKANKAGIIKEDIVYILRENEAFILLYYRDYEK